MIPVKHEPPDIVDEFRGITERCVFCNSPTRYWHIPSNTPVCVTCAAIRKVSQIPSPTTVPEQS